MRTVVIKQTQYHLPPPEFIAPCVARGCVLNTNADLADCILRLRADIAACDINMQQLGQWQKAKKT
ncbi:MAG: Rz1-like lysis system protein LysC [Shewanella sp.]